MMDDQLEWTQKLGDAFLAQEGAVMNTVQALRTRAQATGSLGNSPQQTIQIQDGAIDVNPASQDTVYVPYYDPNIVYGTWWWPAYPPFLWTPPPYYGYVPAGGIAFGTGIAINNPLFMYSRPNWPGHNIVNYPGGNYSGLPSRPARGRPTWTWPHATGTVWNHNPAHRAGVGYRDAATRNRYQPLWNGGSDNETRQERAAVQPSSNLAGTQQRQYPQPTPTPLPHAQATGYPQPSYPVPATAPPVESNHATRTAPPQGQPEHGHNQSAPSAASPRPAEREPEAR
jgi:hypothetical protein